MVDVWLLCFWVVVLGMGWSWCDCQGNPCKLIVTTDCSFAATLDANQYTFSVALTNSTCTYCDTEWSGDFVLYYRGSDTWDTGGVSNTHCSKTAGDPYYTLSRSASYYTLTANGVGAQWRIAQSSWACSVPNTLTLVTPTPANCTGYPSTIELTPCLNHCPNCTDNVGPVELLVDLEMADNTCTDCAAVDGVYTVSIVSACQYKGTFANPSTCQVFGSTADSIEIAVSLSGSGTVTCTLTFYYGASSQLGASWVKTGLSSPKDCLNFSDLELGTGSNGLCSSSSSTCLITSVAI